MSELGWGREEKGPNRGKKAVGRGEEGRRNIGRGEPGGMSERKKEDINTGRGQIPGLHKELRLCSPAERGLLLMAKC